MRRVLLIAVATVFLNGCAGLRMPEVTSCDGGERRAINKSQWNWEKRADLNAPARAC